MILWLLVGLVAHEAAHYAAARLVGLNAAVRLHRGFVGVAYWVGDGETLRVPARARRIVAGAGPEANLVLAEIGWALHYPAIVVPNVLLGLANLLPLRGSDGRNMLPRKEAP